MEHRSDNVEIQMKPSAAPLMRTPKGMRMQIGLFGRRNAGKSSVLNAITDQETSIVSEIAGTTTDPVDKPMELLPLGPVLFIDTAGIDDDQDILGELRAQRTVDTFNRCDMGIIVFPAGEWTEYEQRILAELAKRDVPTILVPNKIDLLDGVPQPDAPQPDELQRDALSAFIAGTLPEEAKELPLVPMSAIAKVGVPELRVAILENAPQEFIEEPTLLGDVVAPGSVVVLVIPIDKEAPKGRIILPQVQTIRDLLNNGCIPMCTTDVDLPRTLESLKEPPALVVTDSQAFATVAEIVPESIPLTGFSVVFSRFKGDLQLQAQATRAIANLTEDSKVLIAESCTHHPIEEDIGTVKIPRLLRKIAGEGLTIEHSRGPKFPNDLAKYDLVIHCGGCVLNRRMMLSRIQHCIEAGVPISNYGLTLAYANGIFERSMEIFS